MQFGKPIGNNQAIQQQLAQLAGEFASARITALVACRDLPSLHQADAPSAEFSTAVAKVRAGKAANRATAIAHQVHGAIASPMGTRSISPRVACGLGAATWVGQAGGLSAWARPSSPAVPRAFGPV